MFSKWLAYNYCCLILHFVCTCFILPWTDPHTIRLSVSETMEKYVSLNDNVRKGELSKQKLNPFAPFMLHTVLESFLYLSFWGYHCKVSKFCLLSAVIHRNWSLWYITSKWPTSEWPPSTWELFFSPGNSMSFAMTRDLYENSWKENLKKKSPFLFPAKKKTAVGFFQEGLISSFSSKIEIMQERRQQSTECKTVQKDK